MKSPYNKRPDTRSEFERTLATAVGVIQILAPAFLFISFLSEAFGVSFPLQIAEPVAAFVLVVGTLALLVGAILCLRVPSRARWVALVVEMLIVLASLSVLSERTRDQEAALPASRLAAVKKSDNYIRLQTRLAAAEEDYKQLVARTNLLPGEFRTESAKNEARKERAREEIERVTGSLEALENDALAGQSLVVRQGVFGLWGTENAEFVRLATLFLLGAGNEIIAGILIISGRRRQSASSADAQPESLLVAPTKPLGSEEEEYLSTATRLGRNGRAAGYRVVAKEMGVSEARGRSLMNTCSRSGRLLDGKVVQLGETQRRENARKTVFAKFWERLRVRAWLE